jgi:cysteine synthase A
VDILQAIGNTTLAHLRKVAPRNGVTLYAKLEWKNPTGSMKDRMALAVISQAEANGRLKPGNTVVEYTGGSTGASLALVCAAKGYRIRIVSSDVFSREELDQQATIRWARSSGGRRKEKSTRRRARASQDRGNRDRLPVSALGAESGG